MTENTNHRQAAIAFLSRGGRFHDLAGDQNKALRRRMIEWLTGRANAPLYECSVSRVRDALVKAAEVDVIKEGVEANVQSAVYRWAYKIGMEVA